MDSQRLTELIERYELLSFLVHRKGELLINEQIQSQLTHDQHITLYYIRMMKGCTSSELAQLFHVNKSAISALISRLEEKQLIVRKRNDTDRRLVHLSLTQEGETLYQESNKKIHDVVENFISQFSDDEIESFMKTYEKLALILDKAIEKP